MKYYLLCLASLVLANPLHIDVDIHLDITDSANQPAKPHLKGQYVPEYIPKVHAEADDLPVVTLPYEKHKASPPQDSDQKFYNFSNIPYAQQPIGDLRFKEAKQIEAVKGDLPFNDGQNSVVCPQAQVGWLSYAKEFLEDFYENNENLAPKWSYPLSPKDNYTWSTKIPTIPGQSESCLTLDVMVPKRIYDNMGTDDEYEAPVMVWFFGGGYVFGSKTLFGSPKGLFESALQYEDVNYEEFIFVAANYRLGAFGWLAGNTFEEAGGYENAGLSDQVAVLDWVANNIAKFGGNRDMVTVVGESAGASSILQHLVSWGGRKWGRFKAPPKFRRAILQSPALFPVTSRKEMNATYNKFLAEAGVASFEKLATAKTEDLIRANAKTSYEAPYGRFSYGPVIDDDYVKAPPGLLLRRGFYWNKEVVVSHNRNEGILFTPPWVRSREDLRKFMLSVYPNFETEALDEAVDKHYVYDKGLTEKGKVNLTSQVFSDFAVRANVFGARTVGSSYQYLFDFFPGIHGQDANYTFGPSQDLKVNKEQRQRFQRYLTSFVKWGNPNIAKFDNDTDWYDYTWDNQQMKFGNFSLLSRFDTAYEMIGDTLDRERCEFWMDSPFWGFEEEEATRSNVQNGDGVAQAKIEI